MRPRGMLGPRPLLDLPPLPLPLPFDGAAGFPFGGVRDLVLFGVAAALG